MNIGIVTTWFERGAAMVSRAYMDALSPRHGVFIYARGGERYAQGDPKWDLPNVTWGKRVPRHRRPTTLDWPDFESWVRRHRLEAVLFNEQQVWEPVLRCLDLGVLTGAYVDYYTSTTPPFFWLYDFLVCNTARHYGVFRTHPQALFVPWGTDCALFQPAPEQKPSRHPLTFFHSSGVSPYRKGTDLVFEAFRSVRGEARLVIHSQDGLAKVAELFPSLYTHRGIEVIERQVGAPGLYSLGDVYVYPSRLEGIGLTIAEAMASGLPVIATDVAPMNEFIRDGANGRLVNVEGFLRRGDDYYWPEARPSVASLTAAMQWYVDHAAELPGLKRAARAYAEEHLDWSRNSKALAEALPRLRRVVRGPSHRRLIEEVREYERRANRAYGRLMIRTLLGKAGGLRVKQAFRSVLSRNRGGVTA